MRRWVAATIFFLVFASSTGLALTYTQALAAVENRPPVESARAELFDAESQWQRVQNDPEALRIDLLRAEQRLELARAQLRLERVRASLEISRAYTQVIDAEAGYSLARLARTVAERAAAIARLRFAKGGISKQDLRDAELRLSDAENALRKAEESRSLARTQLASMVGMISPAEQIEAPGIPLVPSLNIVYMSLQEHPQRLRMQHAVELARTALALLDPSYAPPAQIEAAEVQLTKAKNGLDEVVRNLELLAKQRWQDVSKSRREMEIARARAKKANVDYEVAKQRYGSGLISEIELLQARFMRDQSSFDAQVATHNFLNAAWELAVAIAQPLEVTHGP